MSMTSMDRPTIQQPTVAFDHPALFHRSTDEYLAGTTDFVLDGLDRGDAVAIAVPEARLNLISAALGRSANGLTLINMTEAGRNPGRIIGRVLRTFADDHPHQAVRIIGEQLWPNRSATEYVACAQHEALVNRAFIGREVRIMCPYDLDTLDSRALADAIRTHPTLIVGGQRRTSPTYEPDQVVADYNKPLRAPADAAKLIVEPGQLQLMRRWATGLAVAAGLSEERLPDWALVLTELVTNSIEHAGGRATVCAFVTGGQLVGQVSDTGGPIDPLLGRHPALPEQPRGRGLLIVYDLADLVRLHTEPGATTIEVRMRID